MKSSTSKSKKIVFWLISTIAATIVGYFVVQWIEKKPNLDSVLFVSREKVGDKSLSKYEFEIKNIGDLSIRNVKGTIRLFGAAVRDVQETTLKDVRVQHYDANLMKINHRVSYPFRQSEGYKIVEPTIEFTCDIIEPSKLSPLRVSFYSPFRTGVELKLFADGLRYHCYFRDANYQNIPTRDCQLLLEK